MIWSLLFCYFAATSFAAEENSRSAYFITRQNKRFARQAVKKIDSSSLMTCSQACLRHSWCTSTNFQEFSSTSKNSKGSCELNKHEFSTLHLDAKLADQPGSSFTMVLKSKVELSKTPKPSLGSSPELAVSSCQNLRSHSPFPPSGIYWINPKGESQANAFKAYCEMETDGGGWTLVWSYTFTNYSAFTSKSNAITPRPNWPVTTNVDVPISTTPPLNETDFNAVNFSEWKQLGSRVLIKSNINNWLVCEPGTGSLVNWQDGSMSCQIVKRVTDTCKMTLAPSKFASSKGYGPLFYSTGYWNSTYYYFDGFTRNNWPTHDPCGKDRAKHLKNVADPHGNIYIR